MPPCTPKASPSQRQKRHFRKPETANFLHCFKPEPHEWICLRACKIFAAVPAGDGGGIGSLRASGFSKKKSDFGLEGGGAFALVSRRAERGEKFATPPGAVVAGFSARNAPTDTAEWARADKLGRHDDGKFVKMNRLYNLDAVAYESIMPGFFQIMYGEQNDVYADRGKPKCTVLNFAYSRTDSTGTAPTGRSP